MDSSNFRLPVDSSIEDICFLESSRDEYTQDVKSLDAVLLPLADPWVNTRQSKEHYSIEDVQSALDKISKGERIPVYMHHQRNETPIGYVEAITESRTMKNALDVKIRMIPDSSNPTYTLAQQQLKNGKIRYVSAGFNIYKTNGVIDGKELVEVSLVYEPGKEGTSILRANFSKNSKESSIEFVPVDLEAFLKLTQNKFQNLKMAEPQAPAAPAAPQQPQIDPEVLRTTSVIAEFAKKHNIKDLHDLESKFTTLGTLQEREAKRFQTMAADVRKKVETLPENKREFYLNKLKRTEDSSSKDLTSAFESLEEISLFLGDFIEAQTSAQKSLEAAEQLKRSATEPVSSDKNIEGTVKRQRTDEGGFSDKLKQAFEDPANVRGREQAVANFSGSSESIIAFAMQFAGVEPSSAAVARGYARLENLNTSLNFLERNPDIKAYPKPPNVMFDALGRQVYN